MATRAAAFVLLLGAGITLTLYAMRLVAAAFGCDFSPFGYLWLPDDPGWQTLIFAAVVAGCVALLWLVVRDAREELWLTGEDGGVLVPSDAVEELLRHAALADVEVVTADVAVRLRGGRPVAALDVSLRPLVDGDAVAAGLAAEARELLGQVTGVADVRVRVRHKVLSVKQLAARLP